MKVSSIGAALAGGFIAIFLLRHSPLPMNSQCRWSTRVSPSSAPRKTM